MAHSAPGLAAPRCPGARDPVLHPWRLPPAVRCACIAACLSASAASAHLGGASATLDNERAALRIRSHRIEHRALYDVHHLERADGEIRQYSDHAGRVFAVAWRTRLPVSLPDLLDASAAAPAAAPSLAPDGAVAGGRHSASMVARDRVVHVLKMSHLFMGSAQLSTQIPRGVDATELR